jgi:hypothetical protein
MTDPPLLGLHISFIWCSVTSEFLSEPRSLPRDTETKHVSNILLPIWKQTLPFTTNIQSRLPTLYYKTEASQETPQTVQNHTAHSHVATGRWVQPDSSTPHHDIPTTFKIHFNVILSSTLGSTKWLPSQQRSQRYPTCSFVLPPAYEHSPQHPVLRQVTKQSTKHGFDLVRVQEVRGSKLALNRQVTIFIQKWYWKLSTKDRICAHDSDIRNSKSTAWYSQDAACSATWYWWECTCPTLEQLRSLEGQFVWGITAGIQ